MRLIVAGSGVAAIALVAALALAPGEASATPAFTQQTGKQCGFCHSKPPALNSQGKSFKAKGNKL